MSASAGSGLRRGLTSRWRAPLATAAVLGLATVLARRRHARRLAEVTSGAGPGVRTDDGVMLHVETDGRSDADLTVVFAHGFSARMQEYDLQRKGLREHARLVLFDQRGHGRSGWGSRRSATLPRLGRDLGLVVDRCTGPGPVVLIGHSLGGMAVMALARLRPELFGDKVVAVALLSTSAGRLAMNLPRPVAGVLFGSGLVRAVLWGLWWAAPLTDRLAPFRTGVGRRVLRRCLFGSDPPPQELVSLMQDMWASTSREMAAAFYPGMLSHDMTDALAAFADIPSLVLSGEDDATIPPWHSDLIAARLPASARLVHVPGAGHMVNMTHPKAVNDALRWLLGEASSHIRSTPQSTSRHDDGAVGHDALGEPNT